MSLPELIQELALAAVRVQQRLDAAAVKEAPEFQVPRMRVAAWSVDAHVVAATGRRREFALGVSLVPLGVQVTHELQRDQLSRIAVTVEQTPAPI